MDDYLDSICDVMANVLDAVSLQQQEQQKAEAAKPSFKAAPAAPAPAASSSTDAGVQEVLSLAVRLKNDIISEAQAKADAIIADADKQAKARIGNLTDEQEKLQKQVDALKKAAATYRENFEALLQQQQEAMEAAVDLF